MKQTRTLTNTLIACGVAMLMVTSLAAQTAKERAATVVRLKGAARYSTGNNVWQPIRVGSVLKSGALIQTAADSFVDLVLGENRLSASHPAVGNDISYQPKAEQDVIRIMQDTVLALDKLSVV